MTSPKHLNALQALEASIRLGSQKAAAQELGITPAAIGQRIRTLEDYLGVSLLTRSQQGVLPSPAVTPVLADLASGFEALGRCAELLRYSSHNQVRVRLPADWSALWLQPRLAGFLDLYPHSEVLLDSTGTGAIPDIQIVQNEDDDNATSLYRDYLLPVCSPENFARIEGLPNGEKLEGFPLLHLADGTPGTSDLDWPTWVARHGQRLRGADRGVRFQRLVPAVRAMKSNVGMIICGLSLLEKELDAGVVIMPFGSAPGAWAREKYQLICQKNSLKKPMVQAFRDWLIEQTRQTAQRLDARLESH